MLPGIIHFNIVHATNDQGIPCYLIYFQGEDRIYFCGENYSIWKHGKNENPEPPETYIPFQLINRDIARITLTSRISTKGWKPKYLFPQKTIGYEIKALTEEELDSLRRSILTSLSNLEIIVEPPAVWHDYRKITLLLPDLFFSCVFNVLISPKL